MNRTYKSKARTLLNRAIIKRDELRNVPIEKRRIKSLTKLTVFITQQSIFCDTMDAGGICNSPTWGYKEESEEPG